MTGHNGGATICMTHEMVTASNTYFNETYLFEGSYYLLTCERGQVAHDGSRIR